VNENDRRVRVDRIAWAIVYFALAVAACLMGLGVYAFATLVL
jgi:hypothetical protein